ncbi:hypothetical protein [Leifsonia shinshuensis]|uniref:Putative MFS family arabinose efflux permease n=1 Tax=Leifsonia shinshuensis TaxID=150026 RepID=A0A853D189_9MICO|nr:hypothetical protein [Leifsonia shinshuensis]NYJ24790.1 putative MFS family arabinose efflux permease [Leifsonia shinshuensis]
MLVGTLGAAGIFALVGASDFGPSIALALAPAVVLIGCVWLLVAVKAERANPKPAPEERPPRGSFSALAVRLAIIGGLSGLYVSLVTPFLPLFLTQGGLTDSVAAIVVASMSVVQLLVTWWITRRGIGERPFRLFFVTELVTGLSTAAVALVLDVSVVLVAGLFLARAAFVAIAVVAEETIQYAVMPGASAGALFGISQTAFLVGDATGGAVGGGLWVSVGPVGLAVLAGAITVLNALLLPTLLRRHARAAPARTGS